LLGLIREEDSPVNQLFELKESEGALRSGLSHDREPIGTSVDLPMSDEFKRALEYAEEEAVSLKLKIVGSEHLLLGILRGKDETVSALEKLGLSLEMARQKIRSMHVTRPTGNV
jgi:ATP-dependent Clp protease ATP-binding subunit ClpC